MSSNLDAVAGAPDVGTPLTRVIPVPGPLAGRDVRSRPGVVVVVGRRGDKNDPGDDDDDGRAPERSKSSPPASSPRRKGEDGDGDMKDIVAVVSVLDRDERSSATCGASAAASANAGGTGECTFPRARVCILDSRARAPDCVRS